MDCLANPAYPTVESCQPFNPSPSASPTPTPTIPSAGPAQHFTGRVRLVKGPFDLSVGNGQLTGCTGGSTGSYPEMGGSTRFIVKTGDTTLASVPLGSGQMSGGECDFNLDLGTFPQQTEYVTSFSAGNHNTLTWTLSEMQQKGFAFNVIMGKTS
jgi:hypothetical protein